MVGWLMTEVRRGWRLELTHIEVAGIPLLRVTVPVQPGLRPGTLCRRLGRAAAALRRAEVRRVLTEEEFCHWPLLQAHGLRPVDGVPLCHALAGRLTLAVLAARGVCPQQAVLALRATRVTRPLFQAAVLLCTRVRGLVIEAGTSGDELGDYLRATYGTPVLTGGHRDLEVQFSEAPAVDGALCLWGDRPVLGEVGVGVQTQNHLPGVNPLRMAALLWEAGQLDADTIEIFPTNSRSIALDRTGQTTYNTKTT